MKRLVCETATLADAVMRAARIAPSKGSAYDKAAGVLIDVDPSKPAQPVRVMATDLEVSYYHRVSAIDVGDEAVKWRLPSMLISNYLANLPMSAGKNVELTQDGGYLKMKAGRSRAKFRMLPADFFPLVKPFDPNGLVEVAGFARRIGQVSWACANDLPPLTGIHIDGTQLVACDRYRVAVMPCDVPVTKPVTAPLSALSAVMRNVDDVKLRATETRLEIMPEDDVQLTALVFGQPYPLIQTVLTRALASVDTELTFERSALIDSLNRMLVLAKGERYPRMTLKFDADAIALEMNLPEVGEITDAIDCKHGPLATAERLVDPVKLLASASNASREVVTCGISADPYKPTRICDDSGFDSWLMPMTNEGGA